MNSPEKIFIHELKEGMNVDSLFLCSHKTMLTDKNGKSYLSFKLVDRSGGIEAKIWERASQLTKNFEKMDYVRVQGTVTRFQQNLQFNIRDIQRVDAGEVDQDYFLPHSAQNIETMYADLLELCRKNFSNPWIQKLILGILEDPELAPAFKRVPAATSNHHAWVGGLLEHVLQLCRIGVDVTRHYPQVNRDLVLAGLILHDFGKVEELRCERYFEYTDKGRLIGHLIISVEILLKKAAQIPDFPEKILHHIEHILLSHHGYLEHGSPKEPMTLEAILVHELDHMDSKMQGFLDILAKEQEGDLTWTSPNNFVFKRPLYKKTSEDLGTTPKANELKREHPATPEKNKTPRGPLTTNLGDLLGQKWPGK